MVWDNSVIWNNLSALLSALIVTGWISAMSIVFGTVFGTLLAIGRLVDGWAVRVLSRTIIDIFLALPVLVIIVWLYFCLPLISPALLMSGETASIVGLGLSLAAFVAQIVRTGIQIVPLGQIEAAYCTGLTRLQAIRYILLPQALRQMWAPLLGQYITCYKMSTLASIVAVPELLHTGNGMIAQSYRPVEVYTAIAALFLITLVPINYAAEKLEKFQLLGGTRKV